MIMNLDQLTPAERCVAAHMAEGLSNKEIATLLNKAEPTIKHQVASVLRKTGVPSRSRYIAEYYRQLYYVLYPALASGAGKCAPFEGGSVLTKRPQCVVLS